MNLEIHEIMIRRDPNKKRKYTDRHKDTQLRFTPNSPY